MKIKKSHLDLAAAQRTQTFKKNLLRPEGKRQSNCGTKLQKTKKNMLCFCFSWPQIISCCYRYESITTKCFSADCNMLRGRQLRCMGGGSAYDQNSGKGGEMHYGRIYIQYFALWSSHWSGGLIVCVFVVCLCVCVLQQ